jgi:hypothetical protein
MLKGPPPAGLELTTVLGTDEIEHVHRTRLRPIAATSGGWGYF